MGAKARLLLILLLATTSTFGFQQRDNPYLLWPQPNGRLRLPPILVPLVPGPAELPMQFPRDLQPERLILIAPDSARPPLQLSGTRRNADGSWFATIHLFAKHRHYTAQFAESPQPWPVQSQPAPPQLTLAQPSYARADLPPPVPGPVFTQQTSKWLMADGSVVAAELRWYEGSYGIIETTSIGVHGRFRLGFPGAQVQGGAHILPGFRRALITPASAPQPPTVPQIRSQLSAPSLTDIATWTRLVSSNAPDMQRLAYAEIARWAVPAALSCELLEEIARLAAKLPENPLDTPPWQHLRQQIAMSTTPPLKPNRTLPFAAPYNLLTADTGECLQRVFDLPPPSPVSILENRALLLRPTKDQMIIWTPARKLRLVGIADGKLFGANWPFNLPPAPLHAHFQAQGPNQLALVPTSKDEIVAAIDGKLAASFRLGRIITLLTLSNVDLGEGTLSPGTSLIFPQRSGQIGQTHFAFGAPLLLDKLQIDATASLASNNNVLAIGPATIKHNDFSLVVENQAVLAVRLPNAQTLAAIESDAAASFTANISGRLLRIPAGRHVWPISPTALRDITPADTPPTAVTGLHIRTDTGTAKLSWNPAPTAHGYIIYRRLDEHHWVPAGRSTHPTFRDQHDALVPPFSPPGLRAAATRDTTRIRHLSYRVAAWNARGEGPVSGTISADPRIFRWDTHLTWPPPPR